MKGIIFDASGTLLNDRIAIYETNMELRRMYGLPIIEIEESEKYLTSNPAFWEELYKRPFEEIWKNFSIIFSNHIENINLFPEVKSVLNEIKKKGEKAAVFTFLSKSQVPQIFDMLNILEYFDYMVCREDAKPKPSPDGIYMILDKFSLSPSEACIVDDTDEGIYAGKNAKITTIGIKRRNYNHYPISRLKESNPDYLIEELTELIDIIGDEK
ncbi:MAG: HAD family hydrolase [Candidatus Aenigmatarchaeota archaeon]